MCVVKKDQLSGKNQGKGHKGKGGKNKGCENEGTARVNKVNSYTVKRRESPYKTVERSQKAKGPCFSSSLSDWFLPVDFL